MTVLVKAASEPVASSTRQSMQPQRLVSLDVLRGLTVAAMVLVTDPGNYSHIFPQLTHAKWNNPTAADLIFPCFLFMVGVSMTLSFAARLERGEPRRSLAEHAARRGVWLIGIGLVVNGFPYYRLAQLRIPGILQRIGVCYLLATLLYSLLCRPEISRRTRQYTLAAACVGLLAGYWALLKLYPTPGFGPGRLDPLGCLPAVLDRAVFTLPHMFQWGVQTPGFGITFDPEGVLSTLGALATMLLGVLAGEELRSLRSRSRQCAALATAGTTLSLISLPLSHWMPLNKQIYTPTFALWSSGLSVIALAALFYAIDVRGLRRGWTLASIFGTNAIFAFALSQFVTALLQLWKLRTAGQDLPLYMALNERLFAPWLPPRIASLAFAVFVVLLNAAILYPLYRRRVFLKV